MTSPQSTEKETLPNIRNFSKDELAAVLAGIGEPRFRAAQIHRWLFSQEVSDFESMTSLGTALREKLATTFEIRKATVINSESELPDELTGISSPTVKFLLRLDDGEEVESVLIPSEERMTVCVSSQAGCPLQCTFCATGQMGFRRNLIASEMIDQVSALNIEAKKRAGFGITNVVFMGMGEPMLNLDNVIETIATLSEQDYRFSIPQRKISISTVGIVPGIRRVAASGLKSKLAVSLHSADQQTRERLIPAAKQYSLDELRLAMAGYNEKTGQPVTLVYMLLAGINDSSEDARRLARYAKRFLCKINLIDYNPIVNIRLKPAYSDTRNAFVQHLLDAGLHVTVRKSQGAAINAACGQLATTSCSDRTKPQ
jgi:23S rRNA (adenine2503-C2)-methyltransferase